MPPLQGLVDRVRQEAGRVPTVVINRRDDRNLALLLAYVLREDSCCIDVGAHDGSLLARMLELAPRGRHLAFEPLPDHARRLRERFPAVEVHQAALSDSAGTAEFFAVAGAGAQLSGLREREYPGGERAAPIQVPTERLDDVLPDGFVPTLVKVDVEGAELQVFRGALETLRRHRPVVWFEHGIGGADYFGTTSGDLHDLLCGEAGMRIFDAAGRGPYTRDAFEAAFTKRIWNWVAH